MLVRAKQPLTTGFGKTPVGGEVDLPEPQAKRLIAKGWAEPAEAEDGASETGEPERKGPTMKVTMVRGGLGLAGAQRKSGEVVEVSDAVGKKLVADGHATESTKADEKAWTKAAAEAGTHGVAESEVKEGAKPKGDGGPDLSGKHSAPTHTPEDAPEGSDAEVADKGDGGPGPVVEAGDAKAKAGEKKATKDAQEKAADHGAKRTAKGHKKSH